MATLLGARVIATAGSPAKLEAARALGAEHVIDYRAQDFVAEVKQLTGRRGVDVVFDHVGQDTFAGSLRCLARGGRYVFCGATSGFEMIGDFRPVFFKSLSILGSTMGSQAELRLLRDLVEDGRLQPSVDCVLGLDDVAEAHGRLERRQAFGKIVLSIDDNPKRS